MLPDSYSNSVQHCKDQRITLKLYRLYTMISFVAYNVVCCDEWESLSLNVFEVEKEYKGKQEKLNNVTKIQLRYVSCTIASITHLSQDAVNSDSHSILSGREGRKNKDGYFDLLVEPEVDIKVQGKGNSKSMSY